MAAVGFIGLGSQGAPMAHRIADAGMDLVVWARRPEATAPYAARGVPIAESLTDLGRRCGHIGICVLDDAGVLELCEVLIPVMAPGSVIAVHATILPETCEVLDRRCREAGLQFVDAAVSGGGTVAAAGKLTVMCGATVEAFAAARPVFETFGSLVVLLGPTGSGQRAKLVNNALLSANLAMGDAALSAAAAFGLDRAALVEVIGASSGRSLGFELAGRPVVMADFAHGSRLLLKDLDLLARSIPGNEGATILNNAAADFLRSKLRQPE
ncbi:MAG TPA: NAD(P)-dependent oxidoreductase [Novosphingobium sp.]|nr:NAD(P)-dependent oxidoreductase [Novosphingobium sp.]